MISYLAIAAFVRFLCLVYGEWHDQTFEVKYTDIDYFVFTDAAKYVTSWESPYRRETYRYTPILAWLLSGNIFWFRSFGKIVFILFDLLCAILHFRILRDKIGFADDVSARSTLFWLLNPITIGVSSRGNAESFIAFFVLLSLYFLLNNNYFLSGFFFGISIHLKVYPVVFAPSIYFYLSQKKSNLSLKEDFMRILIPSRELLKFMFSSFVVLISLNSFFYYLYGFEFLHETYLYHLTRSDVKHNFSPYFYVLYLFQSFPFQRWLSLICFFPQALSVLMCSLRFYNNLPFAWVSSVFVFVSFNKVCTSQYFLWYLSLLPLIIPFLEMKKSRALMLCAMWLFGQAIWLAPAYILEFQGINSFFIIWCASLVFLLINTAILSILSESLHHQTHVINKEKLQ